MGTRHHVFLSLYKKTETKPRSHCNLGQNYNSYGISTSGPVPYLAQDRSAKLWNTDGNSTPDHQCKRPKFLTLMALMAIICEKEPVPVYAGSLAEHYQRRVVAQCHVSFNFRVWLCYEGTDYSKGELIESDSR